MSEHARRGTLERAIEIAAATHAGQTDKGGAPYILHPLRVMLRVALGAQQIVAVLHDVVEDSDGKITFDDLTDGLLDGAVYQRQNDDRDSGNNRPSRKSGSGKSC